MTKSIERRVLSWIVTTVLLSLPAHRLAAAELSAAETEYRLVGLGFLQDANRANAITGYEKVLKLDAGHVGARYRLGSVLLLEDRWEEARTHFAEVVRLAPNSENGVKSRARLGEIDQLLRKFNTAEARRHYAYLKDLEQARSGAESAGEAFAAVGKLVLDHPDYFEAYFVQAGFASATGDHRAALNFAERGLRLAPSDKREDLSQLVARIKSQQQFDEAMKSAAGILRRGEFIEAAEKFEAAYRLPAKRPAAAFAAAGAYQQAGQFGKARTLYQAIQREGSLEDALRASRNLRTIESLLQTATASDTDMAIREGGDAYLAAQAKLASGKIDEALRKATEAIDALKIDPVFSRYFTLRARIQLKKQNVTAAVEDFNRALVVNPSDATARLELANLYYSQAQYLEALSELRQIGDEHRDLTYEIRRVELEVRSGDFKGADASLKRGLALAKTAHEREMVLSWRVKLAAAQGESDAASLAEMGKRPSPIKPAGGPKGSTKPAGEKAKIDFGILDN